MSIHPARLNGLDHLRAMAIMFVFFFHYFIISKGEPEWLPGVAKFGWTGVDLFFVLSGFLIAAQLFARIKAGQPLSYRDFFLRRVFRIIPAYLVTVGLYFVFPAFREREALPPLWRFLTFTQNLGLNLKDSGTFSHAWSLCVEEHFYLFLPLILILLQQTGRFRRASWLLMIFFLGGFAVRYVSYVYLYGPFQTDDASWMYWYRYIYYPTYTRLDGLLAGVTIAALSVFAPVRWQTVASYGNWLLLPGLLMLTAAYFLCKDQQTFSASVFGFPLIALGFGCIVGTALSPASVLFRWYSPVTSLLANLSYALYLTHKGIIHLTRELLAGNELHPNLMLVICTITCLTGAYAMHILIEKPFMRLRHRVTTSVETQHLASH
ncbi:acyltransferase family protein [Arsenicibacter rosenii]|uniref:Acyltransferase n=1 Tax=Arsenicibacter rosenii TaxID=1750698 RepID=A0A1S2VCV3_9BACT|nr:acyltransferase [Arsenicibacter rosenii]OIN56571.1 acyltransferase [Arsenicibacter rosenii]